MPHEGPWGIYSLDLASQDVSLLYSTDNEIDGIDLSNSGTQLVFSMKAQNEVAIDTTSEIYLLNLTDSGILKLTDNYYFDTYASFSPNDTSIVFLSWRESTLDLYVMNSDGSGQHLLYDSGGNDADVDWGSDGRIAFTRDNQIWMLESDGTDPRQVTDPPNAGQWGNANLPMGDYDPRFSPHADRIAFERMVDASYIHGGYDIFVTSADGTEETNLTNNGNSGYSQGLPNWSHSGERLVYILAAIDAEGKYDIWMINAEGSDNRSITPAYFPAGFLCHNAVFSLDDSRVYFIGQWWER